MQRLEVLSPEDVQSIHNNALSIINEVGLGVPHSELLSLLADCGARVDVDRQIVQFPADLVMKEVGRAGKTHILYGRDGTHQARFGFGSQNFLSTAGQYAWIDDESGKRREPVASDMYQAITVGQALEHIGIVGGFVMPLDKPVESRDVFTHAELLKRTTKPIAAWVRNGRSARFVIELLRVVAGGEDALRERPLTAGFVEAISPLQYTKVNLDILIEFARAGLPIGFGPMAMTMATAPATLAATLSIEHAEIMAGIVMAQLVSPGLPVTYWGIPHVMDPATGNISFGSPEQAIMASASCQLGRQLGLPVGVNTGLADSKALDAQNGLERGMTLLHSAMAGADIFGHMGICGADQGASLNQLILDNEMAGYLKRVLGGIRVNEDTLALDLIKRVGIGGNFLAEVHTALHIGNEVWASGLFDRRNWDTWVDAPNRSLSTRLSTRKASLLADYEVPQMEEGTAAELDRIVARAQNELKGMSIEQ